MKGCNRGDAGCDDRFQDLGDVRFGFGNVSLIKGKSRSFCERKCLRDCGCVGLSFDEGSGVCRNFYGLLSDFDRKVVKVRGFMLGFQRGIGWEEEGV